MSRISLCMMIKNEARLLPGCLASVRDVVDEMIVVDTGSTDGSQDIARAAGAQVIQSTWNDDFAAPRNLGLANASGDWVLVLDADERLATGSGAALRRALQNATFDCGLVRLHDAVSLDAVESEVLAGRQRMGSPVFLPRVLRHTDGLEYRGVVHETIEEWLLRRGNKTTALDVDILHLGQTPDVRTARDKAQRNTALLHKRCDHEPDNITPFGYLAMELLALERMDEARAIIERGWSVLDRQPPYRSTLRLAIARARIALSEGNLMAASEALAVAKRSEGQHPDILFLEGCVSEMRGRSAPRGSADWASHLTQAAACFEHAIGKTGALFQGQFIKGATSWASYIRLGTVRLFQGRAQDALQAFEKALAEQPNNLEASLGLVEALLETGGVEEALRRVEPLLGDAPDGWLLAASAAAHLGAVQDMQTFMQVAQQRMNQGYLGWHRCFRHADTLLLCALAKGHPVAGPGGMGVLTALMAREPCRGNVTPTRTEIELVVKVALLAKRFDALEALFERRARSVVPGILETVKSILATWGVPIEDDGEPAPIFVGGASSEDSDRIAAILGGHSCLYLNADSDHLRGVLAGEHAPTIRDPRAHEGPEGGEARAVWPCNGVFRSIDLLAETFPRARFVHVVADGHVVAATAPTDPTTHVQQWAQTTAEIRRRAIACGKRYRELRIEDFMAEPTLAIEGLLSFLGESSESTVMERARDSGTQCRRAVEQGREQLSGEILTTVQKAVKELSDP